ncbi:MAG: D-alanyl-D-alanine carboxypeptidase [Lachnospiraceae bacterium]|nr:D-alanyl-D-alanine carboxypeptidase [Lachnospiraceae bacterium]
MKHTNKLLSLSMGLILTLVSLFTSPAALTACAEEDADADLKLYAQSAVLMDADSGRILYEKDGRRIMPMASTTKIMTCILALEYGSPQDYAEASSYASSMPKVKLYVKPGEYYKLEDLLYSLMLESHNDAAVVIAEHIAGSTEKFADMMNQKARDIGCFDTFFITPNGLDATATASDGTVKAHSTTAADLAKIMSYCIMDSPKRDEFLKITRTSSYSFGSYQEKDGEFLPSGRTFQCNNHNAFLSMMEGALSGKTGFTGTAGYCYVGSLRRDDRTYVVALLACGWPNNKTYKWSDTKVLMDYGLENFEYHRISEAAVDESSFSPLLVVNGQTEKLGQRAFTDVKIEKQMPKNDNGNGDFALYEEEGLLLKKGEQIQADYRLPDQLTAPVRAGTQIGTIKYLAGGEVCRTEYLVAAKDIPAIDFFWCLKQIIASYSL